MNKLGLIVFWVVLWAGLTACSKKKPEEGREPVQAATPGAVVGSAAPSAPAPGPGSAAPSAPAPGPGSAPAGSAPSSSGVGCATATTLACEAGQTDGCTGGMTSVHVCVAKDAKAGPPCAQQATLTCPAGQVDACLHDPPQANNHVCVIVAKSTP